MYQAVILEDNDQDASLLQRRVESSPFASEVSATRASGPAQLVEVIKDEGLPDILFADIVLKDSEVDGIEVVRDLLPRGCDTQVIYVTGYAEYCVPVYETDHVYFLLKPVDQKTFDRALGRAVGNLQGKARQLLRITFKGETTIIPFNEITHIESKLRKIVVHTANGTYEMYATLSSVLEQLPSSFAQSHKSFLVNMDAIARVDSSSIELRSGVVVPVGQRFGGFFRRKLAAYLA